MKHKVLILGANGMIGSAIYSELRSSEEVQTYGLVRRNINLYNNDQKIIIKDFEYNYILEDVFLNLLPTIVINCVGITKHSPEGENK